MLCSSPGFAFAAEHTVKNIFAADLSKANLSLALTTERKHMTSF